MNDKIVNYFNVERIKVNREAYIKYIKKLSIILGLIILPSLLVFFFNNYLPSLLLICTFLVFIVVFPSFLLVYECFWKERSSSKQFMELRAFQSKEDINSGFKMNLWFGAYFVLGFVIILLLVMLLTILEASIGIVWIEAVFLALSYIVSIILVLFSSVVILYNTVLFIWLINKKWVDNHSNKVIEIIENVEIGKEN